jgi:predicted SprT family Zn-dependent metalloprotease
MLNIECLNVFVSYEAKPASDAPLDDLTTRVYTALAKASIHFEKALFESDLPEYVITWQRKRNSRGYYASGRFKAKDSDAVVDEVALNPTYFDQRTTKEILSTLVHEQVHAWQKRHGEPSRTGDHNAEWSDKMEELGLIPSSTGQPGGARTGQAVSHYIEAGGRFDRACDELLSQGFTIEFADRLTTTAPAKGNAKSRNKVTYSCTGCDANTWGKPGLNLICGDCDIALVVV